MFFGGLAILAQGVQHEPQTRAGRRGATRALLGVVEGRLARQGRPARTHRGVKITGGEGQAGRPRTLVASRSETVA
ncbi:hypothetical protein LTR94_024728 [Friedmanniomyces endolithicus]|nr:hypothetical protein LTR94_024728 [Friedmanniomyces endolithicus]